MFGSGIPTVREKIERVAEWWYLVMNNSRRTQKRAAASDAAMDRAKRVAAGDRRERPEDANKLPRKRRRGD